MTRKNRFLILGLAIVLVGAAVFLTAHSSSGKTKVNILAAPSGSTIKLDGKGIKSGLHSVKPGSHTVSVAKSGFTPQQQTVSIDANQTRFVGIILKSNSPATENWYSSNDLDLVQSINNQSFDQTSRDVQGTNPLVNKLPYVGPGLNYRIDYGVPSVAKDNAIGIYVRYHTDLDKKSALQWIKDQGYDPTKLDIIYIQGNF